MLFLGLYLARDLLHAPVPDAIQQRSHGLRQVQSLADQVRRQLFVDPGRPISGLASSLFHLRVRERWRDGVWTCHSLALTPTVADWTALLLSPGFSFLYLPFRPLRLAFKYLRSLAKF
jgi:hypothetical protein